MEISTLPAKQQVKASALDFARRVRAAEKVALAFFAYAVFASLLFPFGLRQRLIVLTLSLAAGGLIVLLSEFGVEERSRLLRVARDWFPCVLILVAYRLSGLFFSPDPAHRLDYFFERWDSLLLNHPWVVATLSFCSPWLQRYLELSYLLCYPLVPLGLGSLYLARRWGLIGRGSAVSADGGMIDRFWTAVLLAALTCYAVYPLFPLTPPRVLFHDVPGPAVEALLRKWNSWILNQYSVQACVFPSAHVAAVTATALVIRSYLPRVGVLFWIAAVSIALATVYGRYHYAADAVAGALVGITAYLLSSMLPRSRRRP